MTSCVVPSAYFFAHVTRSDAAGDTATATTDDTTALQAVLWRDYTPDAYKAALQRMLADEDARSAALQARVRDAWHDVEAVQAVNAARRALLWCDDTHTQNNNNDNNNDDDDVLSLRALQTRVAQGATVWSMSRVAQRYALPPLCAGQLLADDDDDDDDECEATAGHDKAACAQTTTTTTARLLDAMQRPHALRRLFAPLLQQRAQLPATLHPLLDDVQAVQRDALASLEQRAQQQQQQQHNSDDAMTLPLHVPLRRIARLLSRDMVPSRDVDDTASQRDALLRAHTRRRHETAAHASQLHAYVTDTAAALTAAAAAHATHSTAITATAASSGAHTQPQHRHHHHHQATDDDDDDDGSAAAAWRATQRDAAEQMWRRLFDELTHCKRAYADGVAIDAALQQQHATRHADATAAVRACDAATRADMTTLRDAAARNAAALATARATATRALDEVATHYADEQARLQSLLRTHEATLRQSAAAQERHARRVREELKAMAREQSRYAAAARATLHTRLALAQLHTSHAQLRRALDTYAASAADAHTRACDVQQSLLDDADAARQRLLHACTQHLARVAHDAHYRRCRLLRELRDQVRQWGRCVHDMSALYTQRYAALEQKTMTAWQAEYLLGSERAWALQNLLDVRAEVTQWQAAWQHVQSLRRDVDEDVVSGGDDDDDDSDGGGGLCVCGDDTTTRLACMRVIDGDWMRQRGTTTLRQYLQSTSTDTTYSDNNNDDDEDTTRGHGPVDSVAAAGSGRTAAHCLASHLAT